MTIMIFLQQNSGFFSTILQRIEEGGAISMTAIILSFFIMLFIVVKAGMKLKSPNHIFEKNISLIKEIALLALTIGLFSQLIGMIQVFDAFESLDSANPGEFAGGIKQTLLPPVFGGFTFIVGRLSILILKWSRNPEMDRLIS